MSTVRRPVGSAPKGRDMTARGNAGQTQKGIVAIINALIGIVLYALAFAIINFLVPGGVLK